jgi:hypothetical protein
MKPCTESLHAFNCDSGLVFLSIPPVRDLDLCLSIVLRVLQTFETCAGIVFLFLHCSRHLRSVNCFADQGAS